MQVLICIVLAASADLLKVLCAKMMASHFHRKAHFEKMQDAINKASRHVRYLKHLVPFKGSMLRHQMTAR